jgi:acetyl-CoA carboxylase biotin carboxyl carrier protein
MDIDQIRHILDLVREHELSEFELEHNGMRIKIRKDAAGTPVVTLPAAPVVPVALPAAGSTLPAAVVGAAPAPVASQASAAAGEAAGDEVELAVVKSPIVGTFYRSPEPGAASFVEIGSTVKKGQVLCIIEAMKLMNEIDSEYDGEIVNIYVENGQAVQYGERMFAIRTR